MGSNPVQSSEEGALKAKTRDSETAEGREKGNMHVLRPCAICDLPWEDGDEGVVLPCGHIFHPHCATKWHEKAIHKQCALCRKDTGRTRDWQSLVLVFDPVKDASKQLASNGTGVPNPRQLSGQAAEARERNAAERLSWSEHEGSAVEDAENERERSGEFFHLPKELAWIVNLDIIQQVEDPRARRRNYYRIQANATTCRALCKAIQKQCAEIQGLESAEQRHQRVESEMESLRNELESTRSERESLQREMRELQQVNMGYKQARTMERGRAAGLEEKVQKLMRRNEVLEGKIEYCKLLEDPNATERQMMEQQKKVDPESTIVAQIRQIAHLKSSVRTADENLKSTIKELNLVKAKLQDGKRKANKAQDELKRRIEGLEEQLVNGTGSPGARDHRQGHTRTSIPNAQGRREVGPSTSIICLSDDEESYHSDPDMSPLNHARIGSAPTFKPTFLNPDGPIIQDGRYIRTGPDGKGGRKKVLGSTLGDLPLESGSLPRPSKQPRWQDKPGPVRGERDPTHGLRIQHFFGPTDARTGTHKA